MVRSESSATLHEDAATLATQIIEQSRHEHGLEHRMTGTTSRADASSPQQSLALAELPEGILRTLPEEVFDAKRTPIQQMEAAIRLRPAIPELYLYLTHLYLEADRDFDAEKLLAKGKDQVDDVRVRRLWEDLTIARLDKRIENARRQKSGDDPAKDRETLAAQVKERDRTAIAFLAQRCKDEPENAEIHLQMGLRLKAAGKPNDAIGYFEKALKDPSQRCFAAFELAEGLRHEERIPEALKFYRLAADSATEPSHLAIAKESLYKAGALSARLKLFAPARRYLTELQRLDPNYKEAASLLAAVSQQAG